jgi:hypothetical protein
MHSIHALAEEIANSTEVRTLDAAATTRPTPEQIDELAAKYFLVGAACDEADTTFSVIESEAMELVKRWGVVPPNAENSRRLEGRLSEFTVTIGNTITIDEARVQDVKAALEANGYGHIFANLFQQRLRHELVKDADTAILAAGMNKRLTEKVQALFGRCFEAKKKSPSLKVKQIVVKPAKKARKPKAEKAGE